MECPQCKVQRGERSVVIAGKYGWVRVHYYVCEICGYSVTIDTKQVEPG